MLFFSGYTWIFLQATCIFIQSEVADLGGSVGCASDWWYGGRGFNQRHSFVEVDHEIFLSLPQIQKDSCQYLAKEWAQVRIFWKIERKPEERKE